MPSVLIVDDDPSIARRLRQALSEWPVDVDAAYGVKHAIDLLAAGTYNAVILDLVLGQLSGFDVLDAMRAAKNATPVIVTSSRIPDYARMLLQPSQILAVIRKPLDVEVMGAAILALCSLDGGQQPPVRSPRSSEEQRPRTRS
jgi:DNA-binding response OmpR family regulator